MENIKTTLAALAVIATVVLFYFNVITSEQMAVGIGVLTATGLIMARDAKKEDK